MARHVPSLDDREFVAAFERCEMPGGGFTHRDHVRFAYVLLCELPVDEAHVRTKASLMAFLDHHKIDPAKYHETLTRAWLMAVRHFMDESAPSASADEFLELNPRLLDSSIMKSHYSDERMDSPEARQRFVDPDRAPIPPS